MPQYPYVPRQGGNKSVLNITAPTVIKTAPGTIWNVEMSTANSAAGGIYDIDTTGAAAAANLIAAIPTATTGAILTNGPFPCAVGIVVDPGTSGVASVSFS